MIFHRSRQRGFTLIELMIVATILLILVSITVPIINPQEVQRRVRDAKRIQEIQSLDQALQLAESNNVYMGEEKVVYISIPDDDLVDGEHCGSHLTLLPQLNPGYSYHCVSAVNLRRTDGNGWIPVDFTKLTSQGFSLPTLPVDPVNSASKKLFYGYIKGSVVVFANLVEAQATIDELGAILVAGVREFVDRAGIAGTNPPEQKDIALVIENFYPENASKDVSVEGTEISVTLFKKIPGGFQELDRPIDITSIPKDFFKIHPAIAGSITLSDSGDTIIFKPSEPLKFGETYSVEIGETAVKLNDGTPAVIRPRSFHFATESNLIKTVTPDNQENISLKQNIVVEFWKPMDPRSINEVTFGVYSPYLTKVPGTITVAEDKLSVRFTPTKHLPPHATILIDFPEGGIRSVAGDKLSSWTQYLFKTGSGLISISPAIEDTDVPVNTQLKTGFEIPIKQIDSVKVNIGETLVAEYQTRGVISPDKLAVTITLPDLLEPDTRYWIEIEYTFESDMKSYDIIRFTTEKKLEVISSSPYAFETYAGASSIVVNFSIPIDPHSVNDESFSVRYASDNTPVTGTPEVSVDGRTAVFRPDDSARVRLLKPGVNDIINVTLSDQKKIVSPSGQTLPLTTWSYSTGDGIRRHTLNIIFAGAAHGFVQSTPPGDYCDTTCSAVFDPNTQVILTATTHPTSTSPGGFFAGWSGAGTGIETRTVVMNDDWTVTATFHRVVEVSVGVNGHIETTPEGAIGNDTATAPTQRTLVISDEARDKSFDIIAADGYAIDKVIVNGTLEPVSGQQTYTHTFGDLTDYQSIEATFKPTPTKKLSITTIGQGEIEIVPGGECPSDSSCEFHYNTGTELELTVLRTNPGYGLSSWDDGGACTWTEDANCLITMNKNEAITAIFTEPFVGTKSDPGPWVCGGGYASHWLDGSTFDTTWSIGTGNRIVELCEWGGDDYQGNGIPVTATYTSGQQSFIFEYDYEGALGLRTCIQLPIYQNFSQTWQVHFEIRGADCVGYAKCNTLTWNSC